jgi:hypothetical protein
VVPHAPITPTHETPTVTDQKSAARWWTWHHTFLAAALLADVIYIVLIVAGIGWSGRDRLLPPQISQILVGALSCTTASAVGCLLANKLSDKIEHLRQRQDTQFTIQAAHLVELKGMIEAHRTAEEKTVPLAGAAQRVVGVYASAAVAAVRHGPQSPDGIVGAVVDELAERIEDFGNRKFWRGVAGCAKVGLDGVGQDADVVPFQSARGIRSQPPA